MIAPLLGLDQVSFIGLQRELSDQDAATLAGNPRIASIGDELRDFDDTAAVLGLADLVISVDTSVVHLAGAMGRPTWILLPFSPDWRWMLGRDDSPWYPTARLYRQPAPGDWDSVIARVRADVAAMAGA
jgi:ADP-heptose:LPS heptosyltransferase